MHRKISILLVFLLISPCIADPPELYFPEEPMIPEIIKAPVITLEEPMIPEIIKAPVITLEEQGFFIYTPFIDTYQPRMYLFENDRGVDGCIPIDVESRYKIGECEILEDNNTFIVTYSPEDDNFFWIVEKIDVCIWQKGIYRDRKELNLIVVNAGAYVPIPPLIKANTADWVDYFFKTVVVGREKLVVGIRAWFLPIVIVVGIILLLE